MLHHSEIRRKIAQADGMARSMLNAADTAKRTDALRSIIFITWAEECLDNGQEWESYGILCYACGIIDGLFGQKKASMPPIFSDIPVGVASRLEQVSHL
jgi:hypothetical protein